MLERLAAETAGLSDLQARDLSMSGCKSIMIHWLCFYSFLLYRMIVKQVQYCDITDKDLYLMAKDRNPSPRIMLNARRQPIAEM